MARTSTEPEFASASASGLLPTTIVAPFSTCASVESTMTVRAIAPWVDDASDLPPATASATARLSVLAFTLRLSARSNTPSSIRALTILP